MCTLLRKAKKKYYKDLKLSGVNDNKKFWKKVKSLFGDKVKGNNVITFVEGNNFITDNKKLAQTFNEFFVNSVENFGIRSNFWSNLNPNNIDHKYIIILFTYTERQMKGAKIIIDQ